MTTYAATAAVFQINAAATAGNLGGGGFNPANTHFIANFTATVATGNSPVIASASYNFVAGDVGAWIYVKSGTNWTPGWYQIASVATNAATVNAAIGQAVQIVNNRYVTNTVAGCATTASPTAGTCGIDYSQSTSARYTGTDLTGTTTTCTSATNPFTAQMVGNLICLAAGTGVTAGWYEIVSVSTNTATLDRTAGTSYSLTTYYTGGAVSLGGSTTGITDIIFFALGSGSGGTVGCRTFIKSGTYTPSASVSTLVGNGAWPPITEGFNAIRGDRPSIASGNQPVLNMGTHTFGPGQYAEFYNLTFTGTAANVVTTSVVGGNNSFYYCKATNTGTAGGQGAWNDNGGLNSLFLGCEGISYGGYGFEGGAGLSTFIGCYAHDCGVTGISVVNKNAVINCLVISCTTNAITCASAPCVVYGNTLYGSEAKLGIGIGSPSQVNAGFNNIMYGFVSGMGGPSAIYGGYNDFNCYFNNTANIAAGNTATWFGPNDITGTNPSFTNISQVTGTTANSSGTTLTDSGKNFTTAGVVAGRDYLHVTSGTGATVGIYGITAVGTTTLTTDNTIGTDSSADLNYFITINRNLLPTGAL